MSRASRATKLRLAAERRDDARAETRANLGSKPSAYKGHTPHTIDGQPTFAARVGGFQNTMRLGRVAGGKFVRDVNAPVARSMTKREDER